MSKKLSASNAYLRDPEARKNGLWVSAETSSAIEGIRKPFKARDANTGRFVSITARKNIRKAAKSDGSRP